MKVTSVKSGSSASTPTPATEQTRGKSIVSPASLSAIATASLLVIVLLILFARSKQGIRQRRHHDLEGYDDRIYLKNDFDGAKSLATTAENSESRHTRASGRSGGGRTASSVYSNWSDYSPDRYSPTQLEEGPRIRSFDGAQEDHFQHRALSCNHDDDDDEGHVCSSPTCQACETRRTGGLQFVPKKMPGHGSKIPPTTIRDYMEGNTIQLWERGSIDSIFWCASNALTFALPQRTHNQIT
jgi:hypothetical protein